MPVIIEGLSGLLYSATEILSLYWFINVSGDVLHDGTDDGRYTFTVLGGEAEVVDYGS